MKPTPIRRRIPAARPVLPDFLTVGEVATRLRASTQHVYALMERGEIAYVKSGRRRLITVQALREYVARNTSEFKVVGG